MPEVVAVFVFMRAWKEQDNFERSSDLTRLGRWTLLGLILINSFVVWHDVFI